MNISQKKTAQEQRRENAVLVLNIIRSKDGINRTQINDLCGLSVPSVTKIVDYLEELKLVESREGKGITNKRVPFYYFKSDAYSIIGVELIRASASGVLSDLSGNVWGRFKLEYGDEPIESVRSLLVTKIKRLITKAKSENRDVLVVGFATPGPISVPLKRIMNVKNFAYWSNFNIGDFFEAHLGKPVALELGVDMRLFAEKSLGAGVGKENLLYFSIRKGLGCAIMYQGKIFRPNLTVYHSLGHLTVDPEGPVCVCGNRGCLELYCGEGVLKSKLEKITNVFEKNEIFNEAATKFSLVTRDIVTLLGIEDIILNGNIFNTYPDFFEIMREKLRNQKYVSENMSLTIKRSEIHEDSGAIGVSLVLANRILNALNLSKAESENPLSLSVPFEQINL